MSSLVSTLIEDEGGLDELLQDDPLYRDTNLRQRRSGSNYSDSLEEHSERSNSRDNEFARLDS